MRKLIFILSTLFILPTSIWIAWSSIKQLNDSLNLEGLGSLIAIIGLIGLAIGVAGLILWYSHFIQFRKSLRQASILPEKPTNPPSY